MIQTKKNEEMKVYGRHACEALFKKRPEDLIRAYITNDGIFDFKELIRYCVDHKLAYHVVTKDELDKLSRATHHENIVLVVRTKRAPPVKDLLSTPGRSLILALEEVEDPHNLGAIMRSCAHFGVTGILYEAKVPVALSASAVRTAEGGAESVPALHLTNWHEVLDLAKRNGYKAIATSSHTGSSLYELKFPEKTILFIGAEATGLSDRLMRAMDGQLSVPGTGEVESLNVSNATAAILSEWFRQGL